jgi:hypothetical protein
VRLFSLNHEFFNEWRRFLNSTESTGKFQATIKKEYFHYFAQNYEIILDKIEIGVVKDGVMEKETPAGVDLGELTDNLKKDDRKFDLSLDPTFSPNDRVLKREDKEAQVFVLFRYHVNITQ